MSDLSSLLGDLYGGEEKPGQPGQPEPPDWASDEALDNAFSNWTPGGLDDDPRGKGSVLDSTSPKWDLDDDATGLDDWLVGPATRDVTTSATAPASSSPAPAPPVTPSAPAPVDDHTPSTPAPTPTSVAQSAPPAPAWSADHRHVSSPAPAPLTTDAFAPAPAWIADDAPAPLAPSPDALDAFAPPRTLDPATSPAVAHEVDPWIAHAPVPAPGLEHAATEPAPVPEHAIVRVWHPSDDDILPSRRGKAAEAARPPKASKAETSGSKPMRTNAHAVKPARGRRARRAERAEAVAETVAPAPESESVAPQRERRSLRQRLNAPVRLRR